MKAVLAILAAILLTALGLAVVVANLHTLTIPILGFASVCIVLALALAIPADLKAALIIMQPYIPDALIGGRRKTDPPPPPAAP